MHWLKKIVLFVCWLVAITYFFAALSAYFNTIHGKVFTFLSLIFPYALLGLVAVTILLFLMRSKKTGFVFLLILCTGYKNIFSTTAFNTPHSFNFSKNTDTNSFRILSWNVNDFIDSQRQWDSLNNNRRNVFAFIKKANADILCLQDARDYIENEGFYSNINYIKDTLGYSYFYFSQDDPYGTGFYNSAYGSIIFSKFPILDSGRQAYNWPHFPEHVQYTIVQMPNNKKLQIVNTHFRSMQLRADNQDPNFDYKFVQDDTAIMFNRNKIHKLRYYDSVHVQQAKIVKKVIEKAKYPVVFCADLNAVPSSYVYHHVKQNLKDAFLQKGFGWGATYPNILPTIRIDVLLHSKELKTTQYFSKLIPNSSDHYPVLVDMKWK
jgi:endonuclease/exonuclease/phosphatase family metal-dependent hydrolase